MWLVVESGAIYTSAALVQLVTYLVKMNAGVILELMLAQLSAIVPALIVIRAGFGFAYEGNEPSPDDVVLTTFHDAMPMSIDSEKSISEPLSLNTPAAEALSDGRSSRSPRLGDQSSNNPHHSFHTDPGGQA